MRSIGRFRLLWLLPALVLAAVLLLLFLSRDPSLSRLRQDKTIRIGYAIEAPYAFLDETGRVTGESPEVARAILERMGSVEIEWILTDFGSLIGDLQAKRFDVIAAGMFITSEREKRIAFSHPTFHVMQALLVPRGNPLRLHSYQDAVESGFARIAVLNGSIEESALLAMGIPHTRLIAVPDSQMGGEMVLADQADGLALSSPTLRWMLAQSDVERMELAEPFKQEVSEVSESHTAGLGAFGFRKEDSQLRREWDRMLDAYIGTKEHMALISQFGFTEEEMPATNDPLQRDAKVKE